VVGEVGIGALVLILTAVLVNTETARTALAKETSGTGVAGATTPGVGTPGGTSGQSGVNPEAPQAMPNVPGMASIPYDTGGPGGRGRIQLVIVPPKVGVTTMHLATIGKNGRPVDPVEIKAAARLTRPNVGPIEMKIAKSSPGHYISLPIFPLAGQWKVDVTIRTSDVDQVTVTTLVEIG
jgi:copper transport protein